MINRRKHWKGLHELEALSHKVWKWGLLITQPLLRTTSLKGVLTVFSLKDQTHQKLLTKDAI